MIQQEAQAISAKLVKQADGYFSPVFQTTLSEYLSELEDHLTAFRQRRPKVACNTGAIFLSLGRSLLSSLIHLCSRCFLGELFYARENLLGDTPEARYQDFLHRILLPRREELLAPSTELGRLVSNRVSCSLAAASELLDRLANDLDLIGTFLGASVVSIDDWQADQGDTHNHGRTVAILTLNGNRKLVYKPHSLENDVIFAELIQWLNRTERLSLPLRHLRVLSRGAYGWQEYVSHRPCAGPKEADHYMYRLGALIFLAYLTSVCDLHYENLVADGDAPILIDTETMFNNRNYLKAYHRDSMNPWDRFVLRSVFATGLIPADLLPGRSFERKIGSGVLAGLESEENAGPVQMIVRPGTDEMGFSEVTIEPQKTVHANLPYLSDKPLHPGDYLDTVSDGFRDAYQAVLTHRDELLELANSGFFAKGVYRQLFRNTELYAKYLAASYHPSYLGDRKLRTAVFGRLKGKEGFYSPEHALLVQSEVRQMLRDDVPYFYTAYSSRALMSADGCVAEEFYGRTIEEEFLESVQSMDEADCFRQLFCLRRALTRKGKQSARYYPVSPEVFSAAEQAAQISALTDWIVELRERYFRVPFGKKELPLYLSNVPGTRDVLLMPEPALLYSGIGSTLFYYQYAAVRKRGYALFEAMLRSVSSPDSLLLTPLMLAGSEHSIGVFNGQCSSLYLFLYLYRSTEDARYLRAAEQLCDRIISLADACGDTWDVIGGYAGVVIFCLNASRRLTAFPGLRVLAERCGELLYQAYSKGQLSEQTGFAHGYAGASTALILLSGANGREDYYAAGIELMRWESGKYNPERNSWDTTDGYRVGMNAWCYGAPGILIARELARPFVKDDDRAPVEHDIALALRCTADAVVSWEDRPLLCHGLAGNLSVLQWYAKRTGDLSAARAVEQGVSRLLRLLREKGVKMRDSTNSLQISFMDGLSGLGYCLLQQLNPDIPSVLALEIP